MSRTIFTKEIPVNSHRFSEFICTFAAREYIIGYAMKLLFSFLLAAMMGLGMTSSNPISKDGTYKGKKLCGSVRIQRLTGIYSLLLQLNRGEEGMLTLDRLDAFMLCGPSRFAVLQKPDSRVEAVIA